MYNIDIKSGSRLINKCQQFKIHNYEKQVVHVYINGEKHLFGVKLLRGDVIVNKFVVLFLNFDFFYISCIHLLIQTI